MSCETFTNALILLLLIFLLLACGGTSKTSDVQTSDSRAALYLMSKDVGIPSCDFATFATIAASLGVSPEAISGLIKVPGRIERYYSPCYPGLSSSEASREMYIGWLHLIWKNRDSTTLSQLIEYGNRNNWVFGEGDQSLTNMSPLVPIIERMQDSFQISDLSTQIDSVLSGFRGHVVADYIWLVGRVTGKIGPLELVTLKALVEASPGDPFYQALLHRFTDGDQTAALTALSNTQIFPIDKIPVTESFGWGSCPDWLYYLIARGVIEGE